ncbi:MAG: 1-deoxy-D-xylulose-5-phosphate synthase [Clostridiales bacterium]|nr:1-deoxy-D-xylulose-5-phosphate synthase [Clostridiales bacterium]
MSRLLDDIDSPESLKALDIEQLKTLSDEIREFLIDNVSKTGGHLASNLGVVELTIALHYVYNSPWDKIIWDVGHQSYTHKILTGRKSLFPTLRKYGGMSGFPKRYESVHDCFETGHSSTSISAALGMARARDLKKEHYSVIAVIGDGSISGGMAFEALNDAGRSRNDLTVILNDNAMSIDKNVGGLALYLARLRSSPSYGKAKRDIKGVLSRIPYIGDSLVSGIEKLKNSFKYIFVPGMLFEELGFTYIGPIDGNNLDELIPVLRRVKNMKGPLLVHVVTVKGKGYKFSEENPERFHGIAPFDAENGHEETSPDMTYTKAFSNAMLSAGARDKRVVAITAAMKDGTGLGRFAEKYPDRFFDVGIAEQHAVTMAAGMAAAGLRPVVAIYSSFLQRAYDQIIHDVCMQDLPVVFAVDRAGLVGEDGSTHHGVFDISYLRAMPNMRVLAPKDGQELDKMLQFALYLDGPVAIRYPRGATCYERDAHKTDIDVMNWECLQFGTDVAILAVGRMVDIALNAAAILKTMGINAAVYNARCIKPLPSSTLSDILLNTKRLITIEDNIEKGGFGSGIAEFIFDNDIKGVDLDIIAMPDGFVPHGGVDKLLDQLKMTPQGIASRIYERINGNMTVRNRG